MQKITEMCLFIIIQIIFIKKIANMQDTIYSDNKYSYIVPYLQTVKSDIFQLLIRSVKKKITCLISQLIFLIWNLVFRIIFQSERNQCMCVFMCNNAICVKGILDRQEFIGWSYPFKNHYIPFQCRDMTLQQSSTPDVSHQCITFMSTHKNTHTHIDLLYTWLFQSLILSLYSGYTPYRTLRVTHMWYPVPWCTEVIIYPLYYLSGAR